MFDEYSRSKYALYAGFFLTLFGYTGRYIGLEPVLNQFLPFAAWSYILLADNLAWRFKGNSPLISRTKEFFFLAAWSVALGAIAELLNLRLEAWHYTDVCSDLTARWAGRIFTWAAVLPSLFVTAEMLESFGLFRGARSKTFRTLRNPAENLCMPGAAALLLTLFFPHVLWPLSVPAFLLLAEGLNLKLGLPSLLRELAGGIPGKSLRLASSGLICGLFWSMWNNGAGASWVYNIPPAFSAAPWALYAGFPILALCAYSVSSLASWLRSGKSWELTPWKLPGTPPGAAVSWSAAFILIVTSYIALRAVDSHTIDIFIGWI